MCPGLGPVLAPQARSAPCLAEPHDYASMGPLPHGWALPAFLPYFLLTRKKCKPSESIRASSDATYQSKLRQAFFADISDEIYAREIPRLHCDEPLGVFLTPTSTTPARFGRVPRNYIRCLEDQAIPWTGQNFMIQAVDGAMGGATRTHDLASSHSPFYSQPNELAELLLWIAQSSLPIGERSTKRVPGPSRRSGV
jgi:hypothetical protein